MSDLVIIKKSPIRRTIMAWETDTHAGSRFGLMNPDTVLYAEDYNGDQVAWQPELNPLQKYLWRLRSDNIAFVTEIARGDEILVGHLGDEVNGIKHPDQLVSNRISDQVIIAKHNAAPWYAIPNTRHHRYVIGTGAHNFGMGASILMLMQILQAQYPDRSTKPLYHGLLEYNGISVDYAHHGPGTGTRDWLRGNVARLYLRDIVTRSIKRGEKPPDLVLRGHYHSPVHEVVEDEFNKQVVKSDIYILPPYCGMNDHAFQATKSTDVSSFGMLCLVVENGHVVEEYRLYDSADTRTREVL